MAETSKEAKQRAEGMWADKRLYESELKDIYRFIMPFRDPAGLQALNNQTQGAKRTTDILDGTGPAAAFRFAGRFQGEFAPVFQEFFNLEPGPLVPDGEARSELAKELGRIARIANGVLSGGGFHVSLQEVALDLFAGTGAMYIAKGDDHSPVTCESVPIPQIALEVGPGGKIWGVNWRKQFRYGHLPSLWPRGDFPEDVRKKIKDDPRGQALVSQDVMYDPGRRRHILKVWIGSSRDEHILHEEEFRASPWVTPRFFVVPGEAYGRGLAHLGLPYCRTTNKVRELALLAAAFGVLGLWMQRNDGVFNPDNAKFEPLAMWQVASTGGVMGPSISRLPVPQDFDVSSFVIADERDQMKQAMMDVNLPPLAGSVRSPTEIAERMKLYSQDFGGVFGRLVMEIAVPTAQRTVDILEQFGVVETSLSIDQLLTRMKVTSPIAATQQMDKVERTVRWLEMMIGLFGQQAAMVIAKPDEIGPEIGRWMGVEERFIPDEKERAAIQEMLGQVQAAQQAPAQKPPTPQQQAQAYVNGGAP